jgi:excisionase family DNA binding protein
VASIDSIIINEYIEKMTTKRQPTEFTVQEFADELRVSHHTVRRWLRAGKIKGRTKNPFTQRLRFLIPASELERVRSLMEGESGSGQPG